MEEARAADEPLNRAAKLQRLHSLSGVVPLGAFVLLHLWTGAALLGSRDVYDRQVAFIHDGPLFALLEFVLVLVPLTFHGLYGLSRIVRPREDHAYDSDMMQMLQRASGVIVLAFVGAHFWELRYQTYAGSLQVASYSTKLVEHLSWTSSGIPWIALGYLLGIAATVFHLVTGMTSFCISWGYTRTAGAQRRARLLFRALGVLFFGVGAATVIQLATGSRVFASEERPSSTACGSAAVPLPAPRTSTSSSATATASASPSPSPVDAALPPKGE